jgi:hypothetical protein
LNYFQKQYNQHAGNPFEPQLQGTRSATRSQPPWWTDSLSIMRKKTNACRRLFQRTRNDVALRETRKQHYIEAKRKYQAGIRKEKFNSWKEYCNVAASTNPW